MFTTTHNECVGFESRWRVKKVSVAGTSQTTEFSTHEMETNTSQKRDIEVQTDNPHVPETCDVDEEKLAEWLKRIYPSVKKELDDNIQSRAFRGYRLLDDTSDANCKLVQTIDISTRDKDSTLGTHISALSWNSTNQSLAVACSYKHSSWCYHEGVILLYTLNHEDRIPDTPRLKLTTESCVTTIEFHTSLPAIIAAGLFSGSIIIWNTQNEDQVIAKVEGHKDGITQISWILNPDSTKQVLLASAGLDGLLSIWNFNESHLELKERHQVRSQLFPKSKENSDTVKKVIRGITCFDFSKHSHEMFIVGAEGGLIVQCSLLGAHKTGEDGDVPVLDSTFQFYQPHKGEVTSVCFSPNRKEMFMSCGSDLEIRIYIIDHDEPAQVFFPKQAINSVSWVPFEERIACGVGKNGTLEIFELRKGQILENSTDEKIKREILTQVKINKLKSGIVAVGTDTGQLQMWKVPWVSFGNLADVP